MWGNPRRTAVKTGTVRCHVRATRGNSAETIAAPGRVFGSRLDPEARGVAERETNGVGDSVIDEGGPSTGSRRERRVTDFVDRQGAVDFRRLGVFFTMGPRRVFFGFIRREIVPGSDVRHTSVVGIRPRFDARVPYRLAWNALWNLRSYRHPRNRQRGDCRLG